MGRHQKIMRGALRPGLLSLALVGWGILRGWWWLGLLVAVIVELPRLIKARKDFQPPDYSRAFTLSWILLGVVAFILWLQDVETEDFEVLVEALPLFFLPAILTQLFSRTTDFPFYTTTFLTHWRYKSELKKGRDPYEARINFGYIYLFLILIAASWNLESLREKGMYVILVALVLWRLLFFSQPHRSSSKSKRWGGQVVYIIALLLAALTGFGVLKLYRFLESGGLYRTRYTELPAETSTQLGKIGEIKLDPSIHWRVINPEKRPPSLMKDGVFNTFLNDKWVHKPVSGKPRKEDYIDCTSIPAGEGKFVLAPDKNLTFMEAEKQVAQSFRLRGKGLQSTLLPTTEGLVYMENFSLDSMEYNSLGTLLGWNPKTGVVDYIIHSKKEDERDLMEQDPSAYDQEVPNSLSGPLSAFLKENGIEAHSGSAVAAEQLRTVFHADFTYTLKGQIYGRKAVEQFLHDTKAGHCEYFATAGCLLMRELGYPARYTVGYVTREHDAEENEWIMRGLHAHAWVRFWDEREKKWKNIDFTPPDPLAFTHTTPNKLQQFQDSFKTWREDLLVWRLENGESWVFTVLPWALVALLVAVFGRNLLKVRGSGNETSQIDKLVTPLTKALKIPPRKPTETFREWTESLELSPAHQGELLGFIEDGLYGKDGDLSGLKSYVKQLKQTYARKRS